MWVGLGVVGDVIRIHTGYSCIFLLNLWFVCVLWALLIPHFIASLIPQQPLSECTAFTQS